MKDTYDWLERRVFQIRFGHERMNNNIVEINPFLWVLFQQRPNQILCLASQIHGHFEFSQDDFVQRITYAVRVKWRFTG